MSSRSNTIFVILAALLVLPGCSSKKPDQPATEKPKPPPPPPDPLAQAVREVVKTCKVIESGELRDCVGAAEEELKQVEERLGVVPSLERHCGLMGDGNPKVRAVAATRIGALSLFRELKSKGTPVLLDCLSSLLKHAWPEADRWQAERVVRAATFLATAQDKQDELLKYLDVKAPPSVRRVGYECLWPNGKMKIVEALEKAARGEDALMRRAVVMGFAYVDHLRDDEPAKICPMLQELAGDKDPQVAGPAALQLARLCVDQRDQVIASVARHVKKKEIEIGLVNALDSIISSTNPPPSTAQRKKATALLVRIVRQPEPKPCAKCAQKNGPSTARLAALRYLEKIDADLAARLGKKLKRPPKP